MKPKIHKWNTELVIVAKVSVQTLDGETYYHEFEIDNDEDFREKIWDEVDSKLEEKYIQVEE